MATVTIKYEAEKDLSPVKTADPSMQVCPHLEYTNSYVDSDPYAGTVYDTNVEGLGIASDLSVYLANIANAPTALLMFKHAKEKAGEDLKFEISDSIYAEYFNELAITAYKNCGFTVTVAQASE